MRKTRKSATRSIAAIAAATLMATSMLGSTVSAFNPYYTGDPFDYTLNYNYNNGSWTTPGYTNTSNTTTTSTNSGNSVSTVQMPQQIYMTVYDSGPALRYSRATSVISAAEGLLSNIDSASLGLPAPTFAGVQLRIGSTSYDYLIEPNAENDATVLTFNSSANLKSGMSKIKKEEQAIMDAALAPYVNYIDSVIKSGSYTKVNQEDDASVKAAKLSNSAILTAIKSALTYTYTDLDLFSGDVTGDIKTYQIAYLSKASVGNSSTQTVVSNDEEFTNFPRLIIDGQITDWGSVNHLDIFNNSNNSWWYALKDGHTLNNDFYWLKGMMIPDFEDSISFDAYAGTEWKQYGSVATGGGASYDDDDDDTSDNNPTNTSIFYYNKAYNYASDNVYAVKLNGYIVYYPNIDYAKAACQTDSEAYITQVYSSNHSSSRPYFCFVNGNYYASVSESPYPNYTFYMSNIDAPSNGGAYNYYIHDGVVYTTQGKAVGDADDRGYSRYNTWFCTTDGRFYPSAQTGKSGYYVNTSDMNYIDENDPYYQYWMMRIQMLEQELANQKNNNSKPDKDTSSSSSSSKTDKTEIISDDNLAYVSAETLAALRASGETLEITTGNKAVWSICGDNVKTPRDVNLRVTYNTKNIPDSLKKTLTSKSDVVASSQVTIGENLEWGMNASMTIKFNAKRANFIAKLYRYDTKTNSLVYINTATIGNTGKVTFNNLDHGGDYLITLG